MGNIRKPINQATHGFRNNTRINSEVLSYESMWGGLGDCITRLPALKYYETAAPNAIIRAFFPDYFQEVIDNVRGQFGDRVTFYKLGQIREQRPVPSIRVDHVPYAFSSLRIHLVDHAFLSLVGYVPDDLNAKSYLKLDLKDIEVPGIEGEYVVIPVGFTAPNREFKTKYINKIAKWLSGQGVIPVFVGKGLLETGLQTEETITTRRLNEGIDTHLGVDLCNKTTLLQTAKLMEKAKATIGVDCGPIHLAAMTDCPIVVGYTNCKPETRLPIRDGVMGKDVYVIEPDDNLECRGCQTLMQAVPRLDFKTCLYQDYKCINQMTAEKFIKALKEIL